MVTCKWPKHLFILLPKVTVKIIRIWNFSNMVEFPYFVARNTKSWKPIIFFLIWSNYKYRKVSRAKHFNIWWLKPCNNLPFRNRNRFKFWNKFSSRRKYQGISIVFCLISNNFNSRIDRLPMYYSLSFMYLGAPLSSELNMAFYTFLRNQKPTVFLKNCHHIFW